MPFDPTSFANLFAFDTFATTIAVDFIGENAWFAGTHECATWTEIGHIPAAPATCPGWDRPPDPDPVDLSAVAALGADFITMRIVPGAADATFDVGSNSCKLEVEGGGCEYRDPLTALMIWQNSSSELLSGVESDGTPNGSGPWQVDGKPIWTGPERLVNPHPPAYFGIDPTNDANQILWRPDDISPLLWIWAPVDIRAGAAHDLQVSIGVTLWRYIEAPTSSPGVQWWA